MKKPDFLGEIVNVAVDRFNRSRLTERRLVLVPDLDKPFYDEDRLWTYHSHHFVGEPRFATAYARAVRACSGDYHIAWRTHTALWAAAVAATTDGSFVECGTGRGHMASAICDYLNWTNRPFFLFDSFLPTYPDEHGRQPDSGRIHPAYAHDIGAVASNFSEWPGVKLVQGFIPDCLVDTGPVSFLHVDLNNAPSEAEAVRYFWPKLVSGGVMLFDDYGHEGYEAQLESADALAAELGFEIFAVPTGQGLVVRA